MSTKSPYNKIWRIGQVEYRNHDLPAVVGVMNYAWFGFRRNYSLPSYIGNKGYKSWCEIRENQKYGDIILFSITSTGESER